MDRAIFGPGGNEENFSKQYNSSVFAPEYLKNIGLDAYEYQCGRGVNIGLEKAALIGEKAAEHGIAISLHAPYFINLSSREPERVSKNFNYIADSCRVAEAMGGTRVVVHCGGLSGKSREEALENTLINLKEVLAGLEREGITKARLCIETMGRMNVLGSLAEMVEICRSDERLIPCIDFGHLNARTLGGLSDEASFGAELDELIAGIGYERAKNFHVHFSRIEFSEGGEVKHLTFADERFGPSPEFIALLAPRKLCPTVICESSGTQAADAITLKNIYLKAVKI